MLRFSLLLTLVALACTVAPSHQQNLRSYVAQDRQEVLDFWTPERIAEALSNAQDSEWESDWQSDGHAAWQGDWKKNTRARSLTSYPAPERKTMPEGTLELKTTAKSEFPHDPKKGDHIKASPAEKVVQRAVGTLLYLEDGGLFGCTGSVIKDGEPAKNAKKNSRSLILTAAHCLCSSETAKWNTMFLFIPMQDDQGTDRSDSKKDGKIDCTNDAFGCFTPKLAVVDFQFVKQNPSMRMSKIPYDYGILVVPNNDLTLHEKGKDGKDHKALDAVKSTAMYGEIKPLVLDFDGPGAGSSVIDLGHPDKGDPELFYAANKVQKLQVTGVPCPVWFLPMDNLRGGASGAPFMPNKVLENGMVFSVHAQRGPTRDVEFRKEGGVKETGNLRHGVFGPVLDTAGFRCVYEKAKTIDLTKLEEGKNAVIFLEKNPIDKSKKCTHKLVDDEAKVNLGKGSGGRDSGKTSGERGSTKPGAKTDPHFDTWSGKHFEYMGGCDLVLLTAPNFGPDHTLDIHIRTKVRDFYSFVERAAVKIGEDVLEVASYGEYFLNGVDNATMPNQLAGYEVTLHQPLEKVVFLEINLGLGQTIRIKTFTVKDFVAVEILNGNSTRFKGSLGMMGDYETGRMIARDGVTAMGEQGPNAFGAEWQVRDDEEMLFQTMEYPQYPEQCVLPDPAAVEEARRRLGIAVSREEAEIACGHLSATNKEDCIYDVVATGDLELAEYAY